MQIKKESKTNCLAKFIIIDADRLKKHPEERDAFIKLTDYCRLQNKKEIVPHFLIVDNPNFEYIACLHMPKYHGQDVAKYLQSELGFHSLEDFKKCEQIYDVLNKDGRSYKNLVDRIRGKEKFVQNFYSIRKKNFEIVVNKTNVIWDFAEQRGSNIDEFFDVIDW